MKVENFESLPILRCWVICNVLHIWECPGHPYLAISSELQSICEALKVNRSNFLGKAIVSVWSLDNLTGENDILYSGKFQVKRFNVCR